MAISSSSDKHLEIFSLIWLDSNCEENEDIEEKFRSIINNLKKFENVQQCQNYIEQTTEKDRLILIIDGQFEREIIPFINQFRQVISIYVYCMDKYINEEWSSELTKVKYVFTNLDELVNRIKKDYKIQKSIEEPLSIDIFSSDGKSTTKLNGQFVLFQVLIDCLLRLKSNEADKNELINLCQQEYRTNFDELNNIHQFKEEYSSEKALWWYTRESFFYKILNAALRTQNIHMMFLFRSFLYDIQQKLQENQFKTIVKVYRSQIISKNELEIIKQSIGQFISINSFFSTNTNYSKELSVLNMSENSDDLIKILFEIEANPNVVKIKPFTDISQYKDYSDESEILFMLGSIFRLENIFCNDDQIWIIQMSLCSDQQEQLKQIFTYQKQQNGNGNTDLRILGEILWDMGKIDLAEKYFKRLSEQLPLTDPLLADLYKDLGKLASQADDFDMSIQWRQKALQLKELNKLLDECIDQENIIDSNGMICYGICHGTHYGGSSFNDAIQLKLLPMTSCIGVEVFWRTYLSSIRFIYQSDDISTRKIHHGDEGNPYKSQHSRSSEIFMLSMNERINKVTMYIGTGERSKRYMCTANDEYVRYIRGIQFHTTSGRTTRLYGVDDEDKFTESYEGYTLGYVRGRSGLLIDMLQFIWYNESNCKDNKISE